MNKKSIEDKFSLEIDAYFNGIEERSKSKSEEYNELLELGKILADKDFSKSSDKEAVFNKTMKNINKGENIMRKSNKNGRLATAVVAICIMSVGLMKTSFAQELIEKVKKSISLQNVTVEQYTEEFVEELSAEQPIPDELKGKIFDKDGNEIEVFSEEYEGKLYTVDGEVIASIIDDDIITVSEQEKMDQEQTLVIKDLSEVNNYTCFNVILPDYLPEGYKFDKAEFMKDENGNVIDGGVFLFFTNEKTGEYIFMGQRDVKIGGYTTGTDEEIEELKINGVDAVIYDNTISWEVNNIIYSLYGRELITDTELINMAESIK
jgi:hypothetical protein